MSSFHKATREALFARVFVMGAAGDGKTYTAQRVAAGLAEGAKPIVLDGVEITPIFVIDTHKGQAEMYDGQPDGAEGSLSFLAAQIDAPYTIPKCMDLVREAIAAGAAVVVIDSLSDFWEGSGGVLEAKAAKERSNTRVNGYTLWLEFGQQWQTFLRFLNDVPAHIIVTSRRKTDYDLVTNEKNKTVPVAVGTKPLVREGTEYEFDFILSMQKSEGMVEKTRSQAVAPIGEIINQPGARFGRRLLGWLRDGDKAEADIRAGLIAQARETMGRIATQAETTFALIEEWITEAYAPLEQLPIPRLRGLPGWLESPAAQHAFGLWNERRPAKRQSAPPRPAEGGTGAGGGVVDPALAEVLHRIEQAGIAPAVEAYMAAKEPDPSKAQTLADLPTWNSPERWRDFADQIFGALPESGTADALQQKAGEWLSDALGRPALPSDGKRLFARIEEVAPDLGSWHQVVAACLFAARCARKPVTLKRIGLKAEAAS